MRETGKDGIRFPCHIWAMEDAAEAYEACKGRLVRDYGEYTSLEDGKVLHYNYSWDEGSRYLVRCGECGALVIMQYSVFIDMYDGPDGYYRDWVPVASVEEADLLNILWNSTDLEHYPFRHFRNNNREYFWTDGEEPEPYDPEELKRKIREKYSGLTKKRKRMLEKMIGRAGKEEEG